MNTRGCIEKCSGCPTVLQCSIWDILTDKEEKQLKRIIRAISDRNYCHDVKITVEIKEHLRFSAE